MKKNIQNKFLHFSFFFAQLSPFLKKGACTASFFWSTRRNAMVDQGNCMINFLTKPLHRQPGQGSRKDSFSTAFPKQNISLWE